MQVAPSQISPGESFDVFFFVRNHTDSTTYYVRAKIYDVRTGALLDTVTLDQSATNTRLFIKTVQSPPDPVGIGRNIVAIATVYTDSGYTTKSDSYEEQEQYFLIKAVLPFLGGGGGVDMRQLREIVQEEIEKGLKTLPAPKDITLPDQPDMSFVDALFGAIGKLQQTLNTVPKDAADLTKIEGAIANLRETVTDMPKPESVDLAPVTANLETVSRAMEKLTAVCDEIPTKVARGFLVAIKGEFADLGKKLEGSLTDVIESQEFSFPVQRSVGRGKKAETDEPVPIPAHLM